VHTTQHHKQCFADHLELNTSALTKQHASTGCMAAASNTLCSAHVSITNPPRTCSCTGSDHSAQKPQIDHHYYCKSPWAVACSPECTCCNSSASPRPSVFVVLPNHVLPTHSDAPNQFPLHPGMLHFAGSSLACSTLCTLQKPVHPQPQTVRYCFVLQAC
jgi:hypothetical protein